MNKVNLRDTNGKPLTISLFLEINYDRKYAVYTLKEDDYEFEGKLYPSIKKLYMAEEDPTEYEFATKHFLGWKHWKRLNDNKTLSPYFEEWREELEVKVRSQAIRDIMGMCAESAQGSFAAAKWLADRGWDKRGAGRPSKEDIAKKNSMDSRIKGEFDADVLRMVKKA